MARQARAISPNGLYYIELRGEKLFPNAGDRDVFTETAAECFIGGKIYGTHLSDTLIKMVVKTDDISAVMKSLSIKYARLVNKAAGTTGKIFSGRFKSEPLADEADAEKLAKSLPAAPAAPKASAAPAAPKSSVRKASPRKTAPKASTTPEATEPPPASKPKKNLPSWLL